MGNIVIITNVKIINLKVLSEKFHQMKKSPE